MTTTRRSLALCVVALLAGCAPRVPQRARPPAAPRAIIGALARREAAMHGLRLSMSVKLTGAEQGSMLSSPAYLAIDDTGGIRLQVLSPFGVTVLDLTITGDAYTLTLPLRHDTSEGHIDPSALADPRVAIGDRMIVALALMFRPKARADACSGVAPNTVACAVAPELAARIAVDDDLRPVHEEYVRADGATLLVATYDDYRGAEQTAMPGSIVIADPASGARMTIRVQRVRTAEPAA